MSSEELRAHIENVPGEPCGKPLSECDHRWHHIRYAHLSALLKDLEDDETMINCKDDAT